ncbi:MAG TPA: NBR1-Ig-like domain-containing protein, partial [Candidatus Obscuribacterales bacterium]
IKLQHGDDTRRVTQPDNLTWVQLLNLCKTKFPGLSEYTLRYYDEDNDLITISSEIDMPEARRLGSQGQLKILVSTASAPPQRPAPAAKPEDMGISTIFGSTLSQSQAPAMNPFLALLQNESFLANLPALLPLFQTLSGQEGTSLENITAFLKQFSTVLEQSTVDGASSGNQAVQSVVALLSAVMANPALQSAIPQLLSTLTGLARAGAAPNPTQSPASSPAPSAPAPSPAASPKRSDSESGTWDATKMLLDFFNGPEEPTPNPEPEQAEPVKAADPEPAPSTEPKNFSLLPKDVQFGAAQQPEGTARSSQSIAKFIKDVSVPDGTAFAPGSSFVKSWRFENTGANGWPSGTMLKCISGNPMGGQPVLVNYVAPSSQVDIVVNMTAPKEAGRYCGYWRLFTPQGVAFGHRVWVDIFVREQAPKPAATAAPAAADPAKAEQEAKDKKIAEALAELEISQNHAAAPSPASPAAVTPSAPADGNRWASQISTIMQMGFGDYVSIAEKLEKHNGNIELVVNELLQNM